LARKRRENTTAAAIRVGDLIEPDNNGFRATVTRVGTHPRCREPHVLRGFAYPNDFSVNKNFRGRTSSRTYQPGDRLTRWL
jgi:hypothetical protein